MKSTIVSSPSDSTRSAKSALVNLGPCTFEIDRTRDSAAGRPLDPVSLELSGGGVLDFDWQHQHRVLDAGASAIPPTRAP